MKMSAVIRAALRSGLDDDCPICAEVRRRAPVWYARRGTTPGTNGCYQWGYRARTDPDSPERAAAEEVILNLEAQGD